MILAAHALGVISRRRSISLLKEIRCGRLNSSPLINIEKEVIFRLCEVSAKIHRCRHANNRTILTPPDGLTEIIKHREEIHSLTKNGHTKPEIMSDIRVRAIIVVEGKLLLVEREKPTAPGLIYFVTAGGGVEVKDASEHHALIRELKEELGVDTASVIRRLHDYVVDERETHVLYECNIGPINIKNRTGEEFKDPKRGKFTPRWIPLDDLEKLDIRPPQLKDFLVKQYCRK